MTFTCYEVSLRVSAVLRILACRYPWRVPVNPTPKQMKTILMLAMAAFAAVAVSACCQQQQQAPAPVPAPVSMPAK